jgi:hypothetical protein
MYSVPFKCDSPRNQSGVPQPFSCGTLMIYHRACTEIINHGSILNVVKVYYQVSSKYQMHFSCLLGKERKQQLKTEHGKKCFKTQGYILI